MMYAVEPTEQEGLNVDSAVLGWYRQPWIPPTAAVTVITAGLP